MKGALPPHAVPGGHSDLQVETGGWGLDLKGSKARRQTHQPKVCLPPTFPRSSPWPDSKRMLTKHLTIYEALSWACTDYSQATRAATAC